MKRKMGIWLFVLTVTLSACGRGEAATGQADTTPSQIETDRSEVTEPQTEEDIALQNIWVPAEAPAIRVEVSDEEQREKELEILSKGTFLYSGETDQGYYPAELSWLTDAEEEDGIAILYACEDPAHMGWGVLGLGADGGGGYQQMDIKALGEPGRERLEVYSVGELLELASCDSASELQGFYLGAWQGGRIAGLYFISGEQVAELDAYHRQVEETEQIIHTYTGSLSNENASESAKAVYAYLQEIWGTACLTGQMESIWMGSDDYEMDYIEENTGKLPAIRGLDFMSNDFSGVVRRAEEWWEKGGIVTICWHTGADFSSGYNECLSDDINWEEAFVPGTDTYQALLEGMDRAVPALQELAEAGVPVLWRPFHELDGGWFWWSKGGADHFVKLWQMMYSRYTDYWELDNLIWVYAYSQSGEELAAWYPGDAYVDLLGADSYTDGANGSLYQACEEVRPEGMPVVFHECGKIPTEKEMTEASAPWLYFMVWHTEWLTDADKGNTPELLREIYNSDYFITLDELPDFG